MAHSSTKKPASCPSSATRLTASSRAPVRRDGSSPQGPRPQCPQTYGGDLEIVERPPSDERRGVRSEQPPTLRGENGAKGQSQHPVPTPNGTTEDGRLIVAGVSYLNARPILDPLEREPYRQRFAVGAPSLPRSRGGRGGRGGPRTPPGGGRGDTGGHPFVRGYRDRRARHGALGCSSPTAPARRFETVELDLSSRNQRRPGPLLLGCSAIASRTRRPQYTAERGAEREGARQLVVIGDTALAVEVATVRARSRQAWLAGRLPSCSRRSGHAPAPAINATAPTALQRALDEGCTNAPSSPSTMRSGRGLAGAITLAYLTEAIQYGFGDVSARSRALLPRRRRPDSARLHHPICRRFPTPRTAPAWTRARFAPPRASACRGTTPAARRRASPSTCGLAADAIRRRKTAQDVVTYIVDRNVNYTNVCTTDVASALLPSGRPSRGLSAETAKAPRPKIAGGRRRRRRANPPPGRAQPRPPITWYGTIFAG